MEAHTQPKPYGDVRTADRRHAYLFLAMEAGRPVVGSARFALDDVSAVEIGRGGSRSSSRVREGGRVTLRIEVPDPWMSRRHARLTRHDVGWLLTDDGSRNGSLLNDQGVTTSPVADGDRLELGGSHFLFRSALPAVPEPDVYRITPLTSPHHGSWKPTARSVSPDHVLRLAALMRIAAHDLPVTIHGPSGSGKELLARAIHTWSARPGPFVAINCGGLPATLVESELFGYRRGAFSGAAADKLGLIAAADGGTLFLDEVGDLPAAAQPVLLRALQERAVLPVGATEPVPVAFRLISATHRDLAMMVEGGAFREDLWARLAGFELSVPPLCERREDLATLIADLGERLAPGRGITLTAEAARALLAHGWPRNVRELEHTLASAIALAGDGAIDVAHLPMAIATATSRTTPRDDHPSEEVDDPRRAELIAALEDSGGNVSAAARAVGRPRSQVQRWMRRWGLRPEDFAR